MAAIPTFDTARFAFDEQEIDLERRTISGGVALSGDEDVIETDGGGRWFAEFGAGPLLEREDTLAWRAFNARFGSGTESLVVPFCDPLHQPYAGADGEGVDPVATATADADVRATTLSLAIDMETPLIGGEDFSINHPMKGWRAYRVDTVVSQTDSTATISFRPPLREAVTTGEEIDFANPRCMMRVDQRPPQKLEIGRYGEASVRFVEAPGANLDRAPLFVEMFSRAPDNRVPDNIRTGLSSTLDTGGGFLVEMDIAVTGSIGTTTLTSGDTAKVAGLGGHGWSAVINSAGGTQFYALVSGDNGSNTITVREPLPVALSSGSKLTAYFAQYNDQHRTKNATDADATGIFFLDQRYCRRQSVFAQVSSNGDDGLLSALGSPTAFGGSGGAANIVDSGVPVRNTSRANSGYIATTSANGQGIQGAGSLPGTAGFIEFDVSGSGGTLAAGTVKVWATNGSGERLILDGLYYPHVKRFLAPFEADDLTWRMEVTRTGGTGSHSLYVGELRVYRSSVTGPLFQPGDRVGILMDSWGAYYNGRYAADLATFFPGVTFFDYSTGGMTTNWGYDWAAYHIKNDSLTHLVEDFAINDRNDQNGFTYTDPDGNVKLLSMGADDAERTTNWIAKKKALWRLCMVRDVQVVSLMPSGTASAGQAQNMADWATLIPTMGL